MLTSPLKHYMIESFWVSLSAKLSTRARFVVHVHLMAMPT